MRTVLLAFFLVACTSELPHKIPAGDSQLVTSSAEGVHVREPGWFNVDMPHAPRVLIAPDRMKDGRTFAYKKMGVQTPKGLFMVNYVELDPEETASAATEVVSRYSQQGMAVHDAQVDGAPAHAIEVSAPPNSDMNGAPYPIEIRGRVIARGPRLFQLQCSTPTESVSQCDRFFASFHFE